MVDLPREDNDELKNRDLSRKPAAQLTKEEKRELKRRFEEFVTVLRRDMEDAARVIRSQLD